MAFALAIGSQLTKDFSPKVIWGVVREAASTCGLLGVAPHDLRRTYARLCHEAGSELEQIQLLGRCGPPLGAQFILRKIKSL